MKKILEYLFTGQTLSRTQAKESLLAVGQGLHSEPEFASFLTVFKMRPITSEELAGFRDAMAELCLATDLSEYNAIDIVGTGGDGKNTFNISTLACFVIAGAGSKRYQTWKLRSFIHQRLIQSTRIAWIQIQ
jgi:anthranilate phosphoribosyltransferase